MIDAASGATARFDLEQWPRARCLHRMPAASVWFDWANVHDARFWTWVRLLTAAQGGDAVIVTAECADIACPPLGPVRFELPTTTPSAGFLNLLWTTGPGYESGLSVVTRIWSICDESAAWLAVIDRYKDVGALALFDGRAELLAIAAGFPWRYSIDAVAELCALPPEQVDAFEREWKMTPGRGR
jgi:hypothetical protein